MVCAVHAGPQDPKIGDIVGATGTIKKNLDPSGATSYTFQSNRPITVNVCDKSGENCKEVSNMTVFNLYTNGTNLDDKMGGNVVIAGRITKSDGQYRTPIGIEVAMVQTLPQNNG